MKSIGTRFSLAVGIFAIAFSALVLYRAWCWAHDHGEALTARQAKMALEFAVAIRDYAAEEIRPRMRECVGEDQFIPEAMSTSYIAREVFEKVRLKFPDYIIKFSSDNPRNEKNRAGPEEIALLKYFRDNPDTDHWSDRITMNGKEYLAHLSAMRIEEDCLHMSRASRRCSPIAH